MFVIELIEFLAEFK
jgi:CHAT domain-containing protein